jgi:hypothetical protein
LLSALLGLELSLQAVERFFVRALLLALVVVALFSLRSVPVAFFAGLTFNKQVVVLEKLCFYRYSL